MPPLPSTRIQKQMASCCRCRKTEERRGGSCRLCRNRAVFEDNVWYIPPPCGYLRHTTVWPPESQTSLSLTDRLRFWHLQYWTMIDSREVEQYNVNSCGTQPEVHVRRLYLFYTRPADPKPALFTYATWYKLIHDILCLKAKTLCLSIDSRWHACKYADHLLKWSLVELSFCAQPVPVRITESQLYHIAKIWDEALRHHHPDNCTISGLNMWYSTILLGDYRLPFLHDGNLLTKLTRLSELRALRLIILSSVRENSPFAFLGGKAILCSEIASYLIGHLCL